MKKIIKYQNRIIRLQSILIIGLVFILLGASFNHLVIKNNEGRMPFLVYNDLKYKDKTHMSYQYPNEIESAFFSDRFNLPGYIYSIGDAMMILAGIICTLICIPFVIYLTKLRKLLKTTNIY